VTDKSVLCLVQIMKLAKPVPIGKQYLDEKTATRIRERDEVSLTHDPDDARTVINEELYKRNKISFRDELYIGVTNYRRSPSRWGKPVPYGAIFFKSNTRDVITIFLVPIKNTNLGTIHNLKPSNYVSLFELTRHAHIRMYERLRTVQFDHFKDEMLNLTNALIDSNKKSSAKAGEFTIRTERGNYFFVRQIDDEPYCILKTFIPHEK
jgi:hypothetical protein